MPPVKYWEIIAEELSALVGLGVIAARSRRAADLGIVDAHHDDARRYIVHC